MLKKLGKKMMNNFGLKILAAFVAVILWIVVGNIDDPLKTKSFVTSVTPVNSEYITTLGKYYEWLDGKNTITFSATAERTVIEKFSNNDFTATADMEKIEYDEESESYRVPVTIAAQRYTGEVTINSKRLYLDVVVEDLGTTQKAISTTVKGNVADGCALGALRIIGSNVLKISGPYSIVSQIDTAVATINVDGMLTDVTDRVVPVLYDKNGEIIDTTKLKLSLSTVTVTAQILNTKDVALEFLTKGVPADGYLMGGVSYRPDNVRIKGDAATLNKINKITVPSDVLDVTGATEDLITTVDITSYLPAETSLVRNSDAKIEVTVKVEPLMTRTFNVPVANLSVENLRDGYTAGFGVDEFTVEIAGPESTMRNLKKSDIRGTVDAGGYGRGDHSLEINFTLEAEDCWASAPVSIPVQVDTGTPGNSGNMAGNAAVENTTENGTVGNITQSGTAGNITQNGSAGNGTGSTEDGEDAAGMGSDSDAGSRDEDAGTARTGAGA